MTRSGIFTFLLFASWQNFAQSPTIIGRISNKSPAPYEVSGRVFLSSTGKPLAGVNVLLPNQGISITTDENGEFSFLFMEGIHVIKASLDGYETKTQIIKVLGHGNLNFSMRDTRYPAGINYKSHRIFTIGQDSQDSIPPYSFFGKVVNGDIKPLSGVNLYLTRQEEGTSTDEQGNFTLELYEGIYLLQVSSIGYKTKTHVIDVQGEGTLSFIMREKTIELEEVIIEAGETQNNVNQVAGKEILSINSIKTLPLLGGEPDILKTLTLLPGISTPGEATGRFNVRGGGFDQNLILLDGAPLYNPSHLFGFFSSINPNMVRNVTLYKGSIPAMYGGRGSSVVDISYKKGNFSHWTGDLSLGMLSSKYTAGGPLVSNKLSVMTGGRASYINWLLKQSNDPDVHDSRAAFYDGNVLLNYAINPDNDLEYSFYTSSDSYRFAGDSSNRWQNFAQALRFTSEFHENVTLRLSGTRSRYQSIIDDDNEFTPFELQSGVLDNQIGLDLEFLFGKQKVNVGGQTKFLSVDPGTLDPGKNSTIAHEDIESEQAMESGIYLHHAFDLTDQINLSYGLRWSNFRYLGSANVNIYDTTLPRSRSSIIGSNEFNNNELIKQYNGFEPRVSINYKLNYNTSVKAGYHRMFQYIHLISNTVSISPIDVWKLSDPFIEPEVINQYSLGVFKTVGQGKYDLSVEGYYKDWNNVVDFKDGADLVLNDHLETELLSGIGKSYGVEAYLEKKSGPISGWLSYTFSRSLRKIRGTFPQETINRGKWYASNFDMPHNFSAVAKRRVGRYGTMSATFTYSTGRPLTIPEGEIVIQERVLAFFTERNGSRIPDNHRLDIAFRFRIPSLKKAYNGHWTFSVMNIYGRRNVFSAFFKENENASTQAFRVSVIGAPFPSLSYELTF